MNDCLGRESTIACRAMQISKKADEESVAVIGANYPCWSLKLSGLGISRRWTS